MSKNKIIISIRIFALIREIVGQPIINLEVNKHSSVNDVLLLLISEYPQVQQRIFADDKINPNLVFVLNDENVTTLNQRIREGDKLAIVPPSGGG
ncbi:MAG: ubiquitin-like small modifier protein 1 [Candidatus Kariarchaeaceae archaeon]|jgi:MoaD family protein